MKIMIGCDNCGLQLKKVFISELEHEGHEIIDVGVADSHSKQPYYEIAVQVAQAIQKGDVDRGILICWSGMGMAIVANKFAGVYAAVCETPWAAKQSRIINNANVLALGEAVTTSLIAKEILHEFLTAKFGQDCPAEEMNWLREAEAKIKTFGA